MSRPARIALTASAVLLFVLVSGLVARVLAAQGAERTVLQQSIAAQAAGDSRLAASLISNCPPGSSCAKAVAEVVAKVKAPGQRAKVLQIELGTKASPGGDIGVARVAWRIDGRLPVVECVVVERTGNAVSGFAVRINAMSKPIQREGHCGEASSIKTGR
jgi:hypothetical protein